MQQVAHRCILIHHRPPQQTVEADTIPESTMERKREKGRGKARLEAQKSKILATKELILLPSPKYNKVPRFERKRRLQERGLIIDGLRTGSLGCCCKVALQSCMYTSYNGCQSVLVENIGFASVRWSRDFMKKIWRRSSGHRSTK